MLPSVLTELARAVATRSLRSYVRSWTSPDARGTTRWHDLFDWVGGYPLEVAKPEGVLGFCRARGFELDRLKTVGGASGCNEFAFRRIRPTAG
jgi:hypothetical protein